MAPRLVIGLFGALGALLTAAAVVSAHHFGIRRGIEQCHGAAASSHAVATGIQALEVLKALDSGDETEARRGLDLLIDSGISTHHLRLQAPEAMGGDPDEAQQWLYEHLIAHRRRVPSTVGPTKNIGRRVAEALAEAP